MSSTRIFHTYTKLPILSTLALLFCNYELYRITKGTHPYISAKLQIQAQGRGEEPADKRTEAAEKAPRPNAGVASRDKPFGDRVGEGGGDGAWLMLNGIPIPSFELLMRPWRRH
ncbi:hypothetical protein K505DRAFT_321449 [Melanomma pulvis-pyrius CBS 109.77]|uniref:Uncharacterized protein n=1 Tax=Melanomma pulvis-pyrius CBS 109.77 TaxID=1314802 RepID=A0A6A6XRG2_9PLEO|nr:hypothetical protein K505DRAFT_321449 [Melanomma pulvis-pyrius CBS 109.77]